jgi:hypothetical protein
MPPDLSPADVFGPMALSDAERQNRGNHSFYVHGRLKPGATMEQARTEMTLIAGRISQKYPNERPWKAVSTKRAHAPQRHTRR